MWFLKAAAPEQTMKLAEQRWDETEVTGGQLSPLMLVKQLTSLSKYVPAY